MSKETKKQKTAPKRRKVNCPWDWCKGDLRTHNLICLPSKRAYGVSWGHTLTHEELVKDFGHDIWERNADGSIKGLAELMCD